MSLFYFVGNYGGPLRTEVYEDDGFTPKLPLSATITILNMDAGTTVISNAPCLVASGSAYYSIPSGSPITSSSAHMVAYMDVLVESGNLLTNPIYFNVLDKASYSLITQWRRKVENSAPSIELLEDEDARDWIDAAVAVASRRYGVTTYTSTLGALTPAATANYREFYAELASLMARTAWHAGRGKWRDEELSLDPGPLADEWARLDLIMTAGSNNDIFSRVDHYNRDHVFRDGSKYDSPLYWQLPSGSVYPLTDVPNP